MCYNTYVLAVVVPYLLVPFAALALLCAGALSAALYVLDVAVCDPGGNGVSYPPEQARHTPQSNRALHPRVTAPYS